MIDKNLGHATAYAYAKAGGYTGTEQEFTELLGRLGIDIDTIENISATASGLPAGSAPTASYNNGVLSLGIPKGDNGDQGIQGPQGIQGIQGIQGETGNGISTIVKTGTSGNVDTYTITFTNGNTTTFTVTNGNVASVAGKTGAVTLDGGDVFYSDQTTYQAGTIGAEVSAVKGSLNNIQAILPILAGRGKTWAEIKQNVKMGYGSILYPVGTDFAIDCPSGAPYDSIVFTVVNHRVENDEHIMTMLMKHTIYGLAFDASQAIIVPSETLAAGTYCFDLLDGYDTAYDGGKSVQFTLANDLAAGGQIVMNWPYQQTWIGKNLTVYDVFGTTALETCVMSEGTGGTYLGKADGLSADINHTQRARYGSNNYKESAMRNWLNSDDAAGSWQTQQTKFQRPCSYAASRAGFVTYLDPEFVAVIREGTHLNRTNEIFDLNGKKQAYSTTEKFFLASQEEIGFASESGIVCGTVFDFYDGAAQIDKIKYDITAQTTARNWYLRTPIPSNANNERMVNSSGALNGSLTSSGHGASAACEI